MMEYLRLDGQLSLGTNEGVYVIQCVGEELIGILCRSIVSVEQFCKARHY